jgi:polyisoprenyl-phosphate glycosyltransferase
VFAFSFYRMLQYISSVDIPLDTGDFCLLDRKVVNYLKSMPERNRFLRGLRSWLGFKQVSVTYERPPRFGGEAKYNVRQSVKLAVDGIVGFSTVPLRMAVYAGFLSCLAAILLLIYTFAVRFFDPTVSSLARGWASLIVVLLVIGGVQLILLGSIGEYIGRIYDEVKQRPNYVIREIVD